MAPLDNAFEDTALVGGVACSASGKRWHYAACAHGAATDLAQRYGLPEIVARVLTARGVAAEAVPDFLNPTLRALLPDPHGLIDMDRLAGRLTAAIMGGESIAVFGDYDVDGATATALLIRFFRAIGIEPLVHIPDRMTEGYGPTVGAFTGLAEQGASLIITVDCGIAADEPIAAARDAGVDVLVLDHHEPPGAGLPPAAAIVNPKRLDQGGDYRALAAVAVTFLAIVAVNRRLRDAGFYGAGRPEPDLRLWLDLVALGTVCDVMPLTGVNRAFVRQGLKMLAARTNTGLRAMADAAGIGEAPSAYHLGFVLGPRINAAGRVGDARHSSEILSCDDPLHAAELAALLEGYNRERKAIEDGVLDDAIAQIEARQDAGDAPCVIAAGEGWHPGVIGIVAARLKERFDRPSCVIGIDEAGVARGSGRSIEGIDLGAAIIAARLSGHLNAGGGHAMAAGFTLAADGVDAFRAFMLERIAAAQPGGPQQPRLAIDGVIGAGAADLPLAQTLEQMAPFGPGHPEPRLAILQARLHDIQPVGKNHLRFRIADLSGGWCAGIAFRCLDTPLGKALLAGKTAPLHLAGRLSINRWQGRERPQFQVDDAALLT